jgi:hypothetical protein
VATIDRAVDWFDGRQWITRYRKIGGLVLEGLDGSSKTLLPTRE